METIFMNTGNRKTNESKKFIYQFTDKIILKQPNKNIGLVNLSIYYTWKNPHIITINLKFPLQLGMINLICLINHILSQTFKIFFSTLLKNMGQKQIILLCKFISIKSKTGPFIRIKDRLQTRIIIS